MSNIHTLVKNSSIFASAVLATLLDIGDIYIIAIAVPVIMVHFGVSVSEISWVATGYIIALTVFAPVTGWLSEMLSRRRLFLLEIFIFVSCSILCGLSIGIGMLITYRIFQGIAAAGLHPISQSIVIDLFPGKKANTGAALYGFFLLLAPAASPVLASYLLSEFDWRALFFINLPIGALAILLALFSVDLPKKKREKPRADIDFFGLLSVVTGPSLLLLSITEGRQWGWFSANTILCAIVGALISGFFIFWELRVKNPILNLRKLKSKPILICSILMFQSGFLFISLVFVLPIFLSAVAGFPSTDTGKIYVFSTGALTVVFLIAGTILRNMSSKIFIMAGAIFGIYSFYCCSLFTGNETLWSVSVAVCYQMLGFALTLLGMTNLINQTVASEQIEELLSIMAFIRKFAGAIGIALVSSLLEYYQETLATVPLKQYISSSNPIFEEIFSALKQLLSYGMPGNLGYGTPEQGAWVMLDGMVQQQALALAFQNVMTLWTGIALVFSIPALVLFFIKIPAKPVSSL